MICINYYHLFRIVTHLNVNENMFSHQSSNKTPVRLSNLRNRDYPASGHRGYIQTIHRYCSNQILHKSDYSSVQPSRPHISQVLPSCDTRSDYLASCNAFPVLLLDNTRFLLLVHLLLLPQCTAKINKA